MKQFYVVAFWLSIAISTAQAQNTPGYRWYNPSQVKEAVIEGKGWPQQGENTYHRLPERIKPRVREAVWNLSLQAAGQYIRFSSNTSAIIVRYQVGGAFSLPHMPATGVSGVDLYAKDETGRWLWASSKFSFGDTVEYRFNNLDTKGLKELRLYLPLYNNVKWLEIGVTEKAKFAFLPKQAEKPVIVYGTSIAQGACATRPGLAWTGILNRLIDRSVINLGFSGNGELEEPLLDLIGEIDAAVFVLDCLPNLVDRSEFPPDEVKKRIVNAVTLLRSKHPQTPILLVEHATTLPFSNMDTGVFKRYSNVNIVCKEAMTIVQQKGIKNIHLLTAKEAGLNTESTVDGSHPNDLGMMEYAQAYARKIKQLLQTK